MRIRPLATAVAFALGVSGAIIAVHAPTAAAAPAGCQANSSGTVLACEQYTATPGPRGAVGLIGDSVLLGSNTGMSTPGLPALLAQDGFGPIRMTTSLGMRTFNSTTPNASAYHRLQQWKSAGFAPRLIIVNLGANHFNDCTTATVATCKARVDQLLARIQSLFGSVTVWWAKTLHEPYGRGTGYGAGMLGWNLALDQAAKQKPNLFVWDWPAAVRAANPPIAMDTFNVHPRSGVEYVKRSRMIVANLPARFIGPRATLPSMLGSALEFVPSRPPTTLYTTFTAAVPALAAARTRDVDLSAKVAAGTEAVAVSVMVANGAKNGYLTLYDCAAPVPPTANVNYLPGQRRAAQVLVRLSPARHLCIYTSAAVDVAIVLQGRFVAPAVDSYTLTFPTPSRPLDRRNTTVTQHVVTVPANPVAVTLSIVQPTAGGSAVVHECGKAAPGVPNVTFAAGETASGAAFTVPSAASTICVLVRVPAGTRFGVVVDLTGVFAPDDTGARYQPVRPKRLLDTRAATRTGGWWGRHAFGQVLDVPVALAGVRGVSGSMINVDPFANTFLTGYACGTPRPNVAAVTGRPRANAANTYTGRVDAAGSLCIYTAASTHTIFDVAGWWLAVPA